METVINKVLIVEQIKSTFLRIICHEMRTPVGAVIGFTDILKENLNSEDSFRILDTITSATKKIKLLSDTALFVSQIDHEKIAESMRPTKLQSILEYSVSDVYEDMTSKGNKIILPQMGNISEIVIEPDLIKTVIEIFLSNAIFLSLPGSSISLDITENAESIELSISHEGRGMSEEIVKMITEYTLNDLKTQHSDLQGIRMAIAMLIMNLHNSEIIINKNTGSGAQVSMIFPINKAKQNALHQLLSQLN